VRAAGDWVERGSADTKYHGRRYPDRMAHAIQTIQLTRRYDSLVAVDHLEFSAAAGSIFGLLGPNGAGKSTLIKMLTTLLPPSSGTAWVAGFDIVHRPAHVRRNIGYVAQMLSADGDLTGYENLLISAKLYGIRGKERAARIAGALDFMSLTEAAGKRVKHYSGGMIRRLEIAQSMLHRPEVLFLDEPTIGLDPVAKRSVWEHIRELREQFGTTILITTHDMQEADTLCDRVAIMHQGHIASLGTPAELKAGAGPDATMNDVFILSTGAAMTDGRAEDGGAFRDVARTRRTARRLE
jgi:ABC-2 type transport system ATP-binding protein